ncbi:MAG: MarR family transcriptional regulator [Chitinophagales bacterium]|nr:MarR family transcriptional regulator [Chitinophagales bacterium]
MEDIKQNISSSLIFLTNRLARLLVNEARKRTNMEDHGLMPHHMGVLADLWQKDGIPQQELAISNIKNKATITRALKYLESSNILVRIVDPNDKRIKRIYLTHKGKELKNEILPHTRLLEEEIISNLDKEEFETCIKVLKQIHQQLLK